MYTVVWGYTGDQEPKRLLSSIESIEAQTPDDAKKEGVLILNDLPPEQRSEMKPLAVVEVTEETLAEFNANGKVFLPMLDEDGEGDDELEFIDITQTTLWAGQPWWHRR